MPAKREWSRTSKSSLNPHPIRTGDRRESPKSRASRLMCSECASSCRNRLATLRASIARCSFAVFLLAATARPTPCKAVQPFFLHFHVRKLPDGTVSSALGKRIRVGHRVRLTGPFGSAFFRPNHSGRTVLVASGTGFAPMWSIAVAAITERPQRELVFVVAARKVRSFYMHRALCHLAAFPNVKIIPVVSEAQGISQAIPSGRPTDHLPALLPDDLVYTSSAPAMTESVARIARAAGARCYTDPFVPNAKPIGYANLMARLVRSLDNLRSSPTILQPAQASSRTASQNSA